MKPLKDIFRLHTKKYTQSRGAKKRIVVSGDRWVYVQEFELTESLWGTPITFLTNIRNKEFYYEDVNWSGYNQETRVVRHHGPYTIDSVSASDYLLINKDELKRIFDTTLEDETFNNGFPFCDEYKSEAEELIFSVIKSDSEIFWFNRHFDPSAPDTNWARYSYWAEFLIRNRRDKKLLYITFSED